MKKTAVLLILAAVVAAGCGSSSEQAVARKDAPPKLVTVVAVQQLANLSPDEIMGTVVARNSADIQTKIQARVERIPVVLGSRVRKGDVLADLDTRELQAAVEQTQAVYHQVAQDLTRYDSLLARQLVTQQEYDGIKARAAVAKASMHSADAALSYAHLVAPFSGIVTQKLIDIGDLAVPGRPLFVLEEQAAVRLQVTVPESRLGSINVGDTVRVALPSVDSTLPGRVDELAPSADPISRTFVLKVLLPEHPNVRPGQFGRLLLPGAGDVSLYVPTEAVIRRGQLELVYVAQPDHHVTLRLVRTGRQLPGKTEILSGLSEGERVVVGGTNALTDGDSIEEQS